MVSRKGEPGRPSVSPEPPPRPGGGMAYAALASNKRAATWSPSLSISLPPPQPPARRKPIPPTRARNSSTSFPAPWRYATVGKIHAQRGRFDLLRFDRPPPGVRRRRKERPHHGRRVRALLGGEDAALRNHPSAMLREKTRLHPDKDFLIYSDRGLRFSYREFDKRVDELAKGLLAIGLKKGDHLGIWATNVPTGTPSCSPRPASASCWSPSTPRTSPTSSSTW